MPDAPRCFVSYSWDNPRHRDWVRGLATKLRESGVDALLDQFNLQPGADLTQFMERAVRESQFVLLVCTPNFAAKADSGIGGIGYEKAIITGEIFSGNAHDTKFVPLLRAGDAKAALPSYLRARVFIDFRDDAQFESACEQLLRHLWGEPLFQPPPLGSKPTFQAGASAQAAPEPSSAAANAARPLFTEGFDDPVHDMAEMQARYGKLWVIGGDGPWWGDVVDGVHRLVNESHATAVKYTYLEISDKARKRIELGDARVTVRVTAEILGGAPHAGAGLLYRLDLERKRYAAFLLSFFGDHDDPPTPFLTWAVNDESGFSVRQSQVAEGLDASVPVALAIEGHGSEIVLSANGRVVQRIPDFPRLRGDAGIIAVGCGRFTFDDFAIWPASAPQDAR